MISFRKPTEAAIARFIQRQASLDLTYPEVGATQAEPPQGYDRDRVRTELGSGEEVFAASRAALLRWEQFETNWTTVRPRNAPVREGQVVAVLARAVGLWSLNACRIIYVVDQAGPVTRYGFGYGTLPGHLESGEERFLIEWDRETDAVHYEVSAFFRPNHILTRVGWLYGLRKVNRFRRDSAAAMQAAVRATD